MNTPHVTRVSTVAGRLARFCTLLAFVGASAGCGGSVVADFNACFAFMPFNAPDFGFDGVLKVYTFDDGTVMTECEVHGARNMASATYLHPAKSRNAEDGVCVLTFDANANASAGMWKFLLSDDKRTAKVEYIDVGDADNGSTWTLQCQQPAGAP